MLLFLGSRRRKASWRLAVEEALTRLGAETVETPYGEGLRLGVPVSAPAVEQRKSESASLPAWSTAPAPVAPSRASAAPSRSERIDPALFSPRGDGQKRFRRGRLIHGLLQRLPDVAPAKRAAAARAWLTRQGADKTEAEAFAREALSVIEDARFAPVFGPRSRAEAPIVGAAGRKAVSGIVDRLVVDDAGVIVLDFKTDRPAPETAKDVPQTYALQLALYRAVLQQVFPGKGVTCALLWTEKPVLMELPAALLDDVFATFA
jgi:ATP-dependent helicase/nuclease subunit A